MPNDKVLPLWLSTPRLSVKFGICCLVVVRCSPSPGGIGGQASAAWQRQRDAAMIGHEKFGVAKKPRPYAGVAIHAARTNGHCHVAHPINPFFLSMSKCLVR